MNPVAAGGVVALAWYREEDGREVPLIRASDLEACQQAYRESCDITRGWIEANSALSQRANAAEAALTAAQAEADRLREVLIRTRKMIAGYMDAEYLAMDETATVGLGQYLDTAIHAAKTEQERGE